MPKASSREFANGGMHLAVLLTLETEGTSCLYNGVWSVGIAWLILISVWDDGSLSFCFVLLH